MFEIGQSAALLLIKMIKKKKKRRRMEEILRRPAIFNGNVIPGYLVCSNGEIYSEKSNKFLKKDVDIHGYVRVKMTLDGRKDNRLISVHRLVTTAFIPNPDNKPDVNHIDGIKSHNYVSNLEWCTKSENIRHAMSHGLKPPTKGEDHVCQSILINKLKKFVKC